MKKWKLIALVSSIVVAVAVAVTLIIIFTSDSTGLGKKYKYPSKYPVITNKDETFITLGNRNITNEDIYNTGILSYGLTSLIDLVDQKIYDLNVSEEEFAEYKKELYATYNSISIDEVTYSEEQVEEFKKQMFLQGLYSDEDIEKAIKLDIVRTKYAKSQLAEDVKNYVPKEEEKDKKPFYFTDAQIKTAINKIEEYRTTSKVIYVVFRSPNEAEKLMDEVGIDTEDLTQGWKNSEGVYFTKDQITDLFIQMYNKVNNSSITVNDVVEYSASSLAEISSTISSTVFNDLSSLDKLGDNPTNLDVKKCYSINADKNYLTGYYYLALRLTSNVHFTVDQYKDINKNGTSDQNLLTIYNKVHDQLLETELTSQVINSYLYENRAKCGIKIYDERLDIAFSDAYIEAVMESDVKYEQTTKESKDYVAEFTVNGNQCYVKADEIFSVMTKRYGALISVQYMNYYLFLNTTYSDVYDFENQKKLDNYTVSYNKNVYTLKEALENGELTLYGYPSNYGWDNFVRDYLGLTKDIDTVVLFEAYQDAVKKYTDKYYTLTSPTAEAVYEKLVDAYIEKVISVEEYEEYLETLEDSSYKNTILYQICENFTEYFYVNATMFNYYFDNNYDGIADEETDSSKHANAKTLINALFYIARHNPRNINSSSSSELVLASKILDGIKSGKYRNPSNKTTVEERLNILLTNFQNASIDDEVFGAYKKLGIRLSITSNKTYSDSSLNTDLAKLLKEVWDGVLLNTLELSDGTTASFPYADKVNAETNALNCEGITKEKPYVIEELYEENNVNSIVFITQATNTTWYHYYETVGTETNPSVKVAQLIPSLDRLAKFVRYYELKQVDIQDLTAEELKEYESLVPINMEMSFVTNILGIAYDELYAKTETDFSLNEIRKSKIEDGTFKFKDESFKDICLKMIQITFEENEETK